VCHIPTPIYCSGGDRSGRVAVGLSAQRSVAAEPFDWHATSLVREVLMANNFAATITAAFAEVTSFDQATPHRVGPSWQAEW
jgi:hypothetical protein